jgi:hypothetical protein
MGIAPHYSSNFPRPQWVYCSTFNSSRRKIDNTSSNNDCPAALSTSPSREHETSGWQETNPKLCYAKTTLLSKAPYITLSSVVTYTNNLLYEQILSLLTMSKPGSQVNQDCFPFFSSSPSSADESVDAVLLAGLWPAGPVAAALVVGVVRSRSPHALLVDL